MPRCAYSQNLLHTIGLFADRSLVMETNGYSEGEALLEPLTHINREHLAAMADAAVADHHNDYATSAPSSPSQKRKRSGPDSSPDSRRSKRPVPITAMSSTPDPASAAYVESAVEAAQAAAQAATADFAALQQAAAERHEVSDPANASSTAAAALGTMYPTLHVPQTTEATFVTSANADGEGHHHGSPFNHHEMLQSHSLSDTSANEMTQQGQTNGTAQGQASYPSRASNPPSKLAVGSEEWHKQRKDNHKEGIINMFLQAGFYYLY